jgi:hypothetical protein
MVAREASATAVQSPRRVVNEAPPALANPRRALDVAVSRDRADRQHLIGDAQVPQVGQRVDVDQDGGTRESKPHGRNEALSASQNTGLSPMLLQICKRLVCGVGPKVIEGCGNHVANLPPLQSRAWRCHTSVAR